MPDDMDIEEDEDESTPTEDIEFDGTDRSWIDPKVIYYGKIIRRRLKKDNDLVIAITGDEGDGKSTLGMQLGFSIDPKFSLERNMMYSPSIEETRNKVRDLPKYSAVDADEAIKILYKLKWNSKMQIFLNTLYAVCRQDNKATILLMPRFIDFNEFFRNHRIKIWIHVITRGVAIIFRKDKSAFAKDPWWFDESQRIIDQGRTRKKLIEINDKNWMQLYAKTRIYAGILTFGDLPEEIKKNYREQKARYELVGLEDDVESKAEKVWKDRIKNFLGNIYYSEKFSPGTLKKMTGLTNHAFYDMIKKYAEENNKPDPKEIMKKRMMKRVSIDSLLKNKAPEQITEQSGS